MPVTTPRFVKEPVRISSSQAKSQINFSYQFLFVVRRPRYGHRKLFTYYPHTGPMNQFY